jgi:UDP-N-acetylmuramoylalanine--D-glutamate ligase
MKETLVILGGGESGIGAALLGDAKGYQVFVSDQGKISPPYREELLRAGIEFEEEGHFSPRLLDAALVVKSPGIPGHHVLIQSYRKAGIPVLSEIEFAWRYISGKVLAITGTNGKTTTTHLADHLFREGGFSVGCGGNIGYGFSRLALESPKDWYVLEVSSFQLEDIESFHPNIAIILNITPDHLDRYNNNMDLYADAKLAITRFQVAEDLLIHQNGNTYIDAALARIQSGAARIAVGDPQIEKDRWLIVENKKFDLKDFVLMGEHNYFNTHCAILAALQAGISQKKIQAALKTFKPVSHRLEWVQTLKGVSFINDSKATNVDAVWYALKAMNTPVIWIAGGTDKGNDYTTLLPLVKEKVRGLVCLGLDTDKLEKTFRGVIKNIKTTRSMSLAVEMAYKMAAPGDTVLLSPACASFDLFKNFGHRGDMYRESVIALVQKEEIVL